jgi:DNA-binding transcriptional regulator YiaG
MTKCKYVYERTFDEETQARMIGRHRDKLGYVRMYHNGRMTYAHRVAWEEVNGPIPNGLCVCHKCDNPSCINVEHLFLGTKAQNSADMVAKRRQSFGERRPGTKFTEEDIRFIRSSEMNQPQLAKHFGITQAAVSNIIRRRRWPHVR